MKQEGFTLLETLIAVFLVTVAIVTFLGSSARGIISTREALNRVQAQLLAQEGVEIVRNIRDNQAILSTPITISSPGGLLDQNTFPCASIGCTFDTSVITSPPYLPISSGCNINGSCARLFVTPSGLYRHGGGAGSIESPFSRIVTITPSGGNAASIVSTVTFGSGIRTRTVKVVSYLTSWFTQ